MADRDTARRSERCEPEPVERPGGRAHRREQPLGKQATLEERPEEPGEVGRGRDDRAGRPAPGRARRVEVARGCEAADDAVVLARRIAVSAAANDLRARCEARAREPEGRQDPAVQLLLQRRPGCALHDQPEQDVVRARVREALPRCGDRALRERDAHQLARRPPTRRLARGAAQECGVARVVRETRRVPEEVLDRDPVTVRNESGQPALDRVPECQPALGDELERDDGDERLRDAADAEPVTRAQRCARRQHSEAPRRSTAGGSVVDEHEGTGASLRHDRPEQLSERTVGRRRRAGLGGTRAGERHRHESESRDPLHRSSVLRPIGSLTSPPRGPAHRVRTSTASRSATTCAAPTR